MLVVEDDGLLLELVADDLRDHGLVVYEAHNGDQALRILAQGAEVDALFTDISMPGMSGWELAVKARQIRPDLPVVYASGYSPTDHNLVPGSVFLPKPYRAETVIRALEKVAPP